MKISNNYKPYDILTFGDTCVDLILTGSDLTPHYGQVEKLVDDYYLEMGGSSCIFACQAAKLGLRVGILGRVGDDAFGRLVIHRLQECGVDTGKMVIDPHLKTGIGVALCQKNDRAILTYLGSINSLQPDDISDEILASTKHLHHGSFFLQTGLRPIMGDIFKRAKQLGTSTSLDPNWDPEEKWNHDLQELLSFVDVFMPNEQEALKISRQESLDQAAIWFFEKGVQMITVKQGERGARVYAGQNILEYPVEPVICGDTVGAGDSFDAGFLASWLRGYTNSQSLAIASFCGRAVASQMGGVIGQPHWVDVANFIDNN